MEILPELFFLLAVLTSLVLNFLLLRKHRNICKGIYHLELTIHEVLTKNAADYTHTRNKIDSMSHELHRSLECLRMSLEHTKPIKTNNWDSVREAFKGPTKVEINE